MIHKSREQSVGIIHGICVCMYTDIEKGVGGNFAAVAAGRSNSSNTISVEIVFVMMVATGDGD